MKNLEAEKTLLSSLFLDPDKFPAVAEIVKAECFYNSKHQAIFAAIERLYTAGSSIDPLSVYDELKKMGLEILASDIVNIAGYYPSAEAAEHHAEIVKEKHTRRAAVLAMKQAITAIQDETQEARDIISTVQKQLDDSLPGERKTSGIYPEIVDIAEKIVDMPQGGYENYVPTGFIDLDNAVMLCNGTLTIIGAAPRVGKTSFVLCAMRNIEKQGKRPLLLTLEMTRARILENIIAQEMGVSHQNMITGRLTDEQASEITKRMGKWAESRIGVLDGRWSASQIRHRAIKEKRELGLDIIFIDALGKMPPPEGMSRAKRYEVYEANTEILDSLAIELNIPVVLTHHLNREGAKGKPTLFDLNEAGEKFADNVILIHREWLSNPTKGNKHIAEFIIAKNRDGDINTIKLGWHGPTKTFYSLETRHEEPEEFWEKE